MVEPAEQAIWVSVAAAARTLRITEAAVRKRIRAGTMRARGERGRTEVLIQPHLQPHPGTHPSSVLVEYELLTTSAREAARLAGELAELRARLADTQLDRDRWHRAAMEARQEARVAEAARDAAERELRLLLGRLQANRS
jgi:hypothetical protein